MSDSIIGRLFEEIKLSLFEQIKPRMQQAMEAAFDEAWEAAMQKLATTPASVDRKAEHATTHQPARSKPFNNVNVRAKWGVSKQAVQGALTATHGTMTAKDIAEWGEANNLKVAVTSVRTTLAKMQKAGEVKRRKDRYFLSTTSANRVAEDKSSESQGADVVHAFKGAA